MHGAFHVAGELGADQPYGDGIVEHTGLVNQLVCGAANGNAKGGPAGTAFLHDSSLNAAEIVDSRPRPRTILSMSWIGWALLSAVFAAATALLAKVGVEHVDSNLAMALRTTVVLIFAWSIALALGKHGEIRSIDRRTLLFLTLSGLATGLSWLCYFRALQLGPASRVAPLDKLSVPLVMVFAWLLLGEKLTPPSLIGGLLITAGAIVIVMG
jgi:transporter family protein